MTTKIVFAYASAGCYACKVLKPRFGELMKNVGFDNVEYLDIMDENNKDKAEGLRIRGIPTVIFFDDITEIGREVGNLPDEEYLKYFKG